MNRQVLYVMMAALILIFGCQKEKSFEQGNSTSQGSLQSDALGDCLPKTVNGTYVAGTALISTSNTLTVDVNVVTTGNYVVTTDTVNGFYFKGSGVFASVGINTITLNGYGTPFSAGSNNFVVSYDSSLCDIQVTVLPQGSGGPATFTLAGAPASCTNAVINGTYTLNTPLTSSNTVTISVNVTAAGSYSVSTTYQGMTFAKSGVFSTTGTQTIVLIGSGTPTTAGVNVVPVTAGNSGCSFSINVESSAAGSLGGGPGACTPSTVNGTYTVGTVLNTSNTVQVQITATAAGGYNIKSDTVNGMSFSASGSAVVGTQNITLNGAGTPVASGPQIFTLRFGSSICTFTVDCQPAVTLSNDYFPRTTNSNWSYEYDDNPNDSLYRVAIAQTLTANSLTYNIFLQNDGSGLDSSGYYRKNAGDYFEWFNAGLFLGYDNGVWGEYIMLKDNVAAATNWKSSGFMGTIGGTALNVRFSYTVLQKDVPVTIDASTGSTTYQNVIVVEEKLEVEVAPGTWQDATNAIDYYGKSYYAKGIGLIKFEAYNATSTIVLIKQELRRYQVF